MNTERKPSLSLANLKHNSANWRAPRMKILFRIIYYLRASVDIVHREDYYKHPEKYCCLCERRLFWFQKFLGNKAVRMAAFGGVPAHILCAADYFREKIRARPLGNENEQAIRRLLHIDSK